MESTDSAFVSSIRHHYRNLRGVGIGLRCAFADAATGKALADIQLGVRAVHGLASISTRLEELREVRDQSFITDWNRTQRALFRPGVNPPGLADMFGAYAEILNETRNRYAASITDIDARAQKHKHGLYRSYSHLLSQSGALKRHIRTIESVTGTMDTLLDHAKGLGEGGELVFLRAITPDLRRAGLIPGR